VSSGTAGRNPEHYDGLEEEDQRVAQGGESPNEAVNELMNEYQTPDSAEQEDTTPQSRQAEVAAGSKEYEKEYRLSTLNRLLMRRIPLDEIAKQLGVSVRTVQRDREELYRRMRDEAAAMDLNEFVGDTMSFYKEARAMTLRIATATKNPLSTRLAAMSRSMQSHKDMTIVMAQAGVFDVLKFKAKEEDSNSDLSVLIAAAEAIMDDETEGVDDINEFESMEDDIVQLL